MKNIRICGNYLGGLWIRIKVSKDIETEIDIYRMTNNYQIRELLLDSIEYGLPNLDLELFESREKRM